MIEILTILSGSWPLAAMFVSVIGGVTLVLVVNRSMNVSKEHLQLQYRGLIADKDSEIARLRIIEHQRLKEVGR